MCCFFSSVKKLRLYWLSALNTTPFFTLVKVCTPDFSVSCWKVGWKWEKFVLGFPPPPPKTFMELHKSLSEKQALNLLVTLRVIIFHRSHFFYFCIFLLHQNVIFHSWYLWSLSPRDDFQVVQSVILALGLTPTLLLQLHSVGSLRFSILAFHVFSFTYYN